jgi:hypothetical protein
VEFNFERFTFSGGRFSPKASIRANGVLGLSQGLMHRAGIADDRWFAILHYDRTAKVIGIQPTRDEKEQGATRIIYRESEEPKNVTGSIAAKAFLNYFQIRYEKTKSYDAEWREAEKLIIVKLPEN